MTLIWNKKPGARASGIVAVAVSAAAGLIVLFGYGLGIERIVRMLPNYPAIMPTTAISFMFLAASIGSIRSAFPVSRWMGRCGVWAVVAIAVINLAMSAYGAVNSLDAVLGLSLRSGDMMSPGTAYGLILAALCVGALAQGGARADLALYGAMTGLTTAIGVLCLHSFDPNSPMSVPLFRATAVPTAVLFVLTFAAVLIELNLFSDTGESLSDADAFSDDMDVPNDMDRTA